MIHIIVLSFYQVTLSFLVLITTQSDKNNDILKAKNVELENWKKHNFYKEVEDKGEQFISARWVKTPKYKDENITYKARLVARSFEEEN